MRTYIFICVFFFGFFVQSTISLCFLWYLVGEFFVSGDHLSRTYLLAPIDSLPCVAGLGKQEKLLDFHCMQCWLSLCVRMRECFESYYYYYYNYLDAFFSVCFQYTLNELNTRLFRVHLCRSRACACFPIHFNSIRLISIILESILWL